MTQRSYATDPDVKCSPNCCAIWICHSMSVLSPHISDQDGHWGRVLVAWGHILDCIFHVPSVEPMQILAATHLLWPIESSIFQYLSRSFQTSPKNSSWNISEKRCQTELLALEQEVMTGHDWPITRCRPPLSQCQALCKCPGKHKGLKSFGVTTLAI